MPHFYDPRHPHFSTSPKFCYCIPVKFIVLAMQLAAMVWQIGILCFFERDSIFIFARVLLAIYLAFTFAVFLTEYKFFMRVHFGFAVLCVTVPLAYFAFGSFRLFGAIYRYGYNSPDADEYIAIFKTAIILIVCVFYADMCYKLIKALDNESILPQFFTQQSSQSNHNAIDTSERANLIYSKMGDQYLCLDQVKEEGKVPPPPPTANAVPVQAVPPPVHPATFVKVPAPPPGIQKDKSTSKIETVTDQKSSRMDASVSTAPDGETDGKGHPTLVRSLIAGVNILFMILLAFWLATLLTGLHFADIGFINKMFTG